MSTTILKETKTIIHKAIIVSMSVLYIVGPFHKEVNELFHTISHSFDKPQHVLSHKTNEHYFIKNAESKNHNHQPSIVYHEHTLISFLSKVLEQSQDSNAPAKTPLSIHKIDKHISNNYTKEKDEPLVEILAKRHNYIDVDGCICKGYVRGHKKPPACT